ncbi:MAG: cytidine deaminase [Nitrososphaerota archaeon]|nr:cytidine deaminase [Nitrososphaerota archaeon]
MGHEEIIAEAVRAIKPHRVEDRLFGNVAAVVVSEKGNHYAGLCIDTPSGTGFCAEAAAIGAMVTAGEYRIKEVVAVSRHDDGELYVLPPCGRCREFMRQIDEGNLEAEVVLGRTESSKLRDLLPRHEWPDRLGK